MMTSIRNPRPESKPDQRVRKAASEFEAQWRDPERTLVDYVAAAWSRKFWIGVVGGIAGLVAIVYALTRPNVYASQASLMVVGNRSGGNAAEVAANMLRTGNIGPSQVLAALEVINSSVVAERVAERLGAAEITKPYQPQRADEEERQKMGIIDSATDWMHRIQSSWFKSAASPSSLKLDVATEVFRRSFVAWADERASLIKLVYRAGSREQAQLVLKEVVQVAVERYREVCAPKESREWVLQRLGVVETDYNAAKVEYDTFVNTHGHVKFTEEIVAQERARATSATALFAMKRARDTTRDNLQKWSEKLDKLKPQRTRELEVTEDNATARGDLIKQLVELQNRKIEKELVDSVEILKNDTRYRVLLAQLHNVQTQMDDLDKPRHVPVVDDNPEWIAIDARIRALTLTQAELETEMPRLEAEVNQLDAALKNLYAQQETANKLVERLDLAKAKLAEARRANDSWDFEAQLSTLGLSSLQPVDTPTLPLLKEGPQRTRLILAGLAGGLLASLTLIMLMVRMSKTFLRTSEVAVCLGRGDVVGMPWLERGNVRRFRLARKRGWD